MINIIKGSIAKFCMVAMFLPAAAFAQHSFSGTITDSASGEKLPLVGVTVNSTLLTTNTDLDGKFNVHLSDGNYSVSFVYLGYKTKTIEVVLPKDSSIHVQLSTSTLISNEVVVSATRAGDKTPTAYTNIDKEYLQKSNVGQDMPFLLNFQSLRLNPFGLPCSRRLVVDMQSAASSIPGSRKMDQAP